MAATGSRGRRRVYSLSCMAVVMREGRGVKDEDVVE